MPKVADVPKMLKPYTFHGVHLEWSDDADGHAVGDCPFCGKEGKFSVQVSTGLWRCFVCNAGTDNGKATQGGNATTFLRLLWDTADAMADFSWLMESRGYLYGSTLKEWGARCRFGQWLLPGYSGERKLMTLYKLVEDRATGKLRLLATSEVGHGLYGANLYDPTRDEVWLMEGQWDGPAIWEVARRAKRADDGSLTVTGAEESSLLADVNVLAVPGCTTFKESWLPLFAGKRVTIMYDSDQPRLVNGKLIPAAGWAGMRRVAEMLCAATEPPSEVRVLRWGSDGFDPSLPDGYDVRDALRAGGDDLRGRVAALGELLQRVEPMPTDWVAGRTAAAKAKGGAEIECLPCTSWATLGMAWRKAMKWTDGLDRALGVMLACSLSTRAIGDQLWVKVIGPAACGKSTLCEAISVNRKHVFAKDTLTRLVSGYQSDQSGTENMSMVEHLSDKTLVVNDGDTLIQSPNLPQILSQLRAFYGRNIRAQFGNRMSKDYEGKSTTIIICGTSSLKVLDTSELGERFLDCVIMDEIDPELEDEILWRVARRTERNLAMASNGHAASRQDPAMLNAMQLTGGYIDYLRDNDTEILAGIDMDDAALQSCIHLGKFVAYMRARPSLKQDEAAEREFASRLVSQIIRLAKCLAGVMNRKSVDAEVLRRSRQVAMDTARGRTLELAKYLRRAGQDGAEVKSLAMWTHQTEDKERHLLRFLRKIGVAETHQPKVKGLATRPKWRLTERFERLYDEVNDPPA